MTRVLITGMSGTGKSTAARELARRGHRAVDLDAPEWSQWVAADPSDALTPAEGRDWVWRIDKVKALLTASTDERLFVSGCAGNMAECYPLIDAIVLLAAPVATIMDRLAARPAGSYGHDADDRRKAAELIAIVEPMLREAADHEIDASLPIDEVVRRIAELAVEEPVDRRR